MTAVRFQHFMDNLAHILDNLGADLGDVAVVLDNASVHNHADCAAAEVKKLPPYSPFLNPIENCFSVFQLKVKEMLRQPAVVERIGAVPAGISVLEHRMSVLGECQTKF